MCHQLVFTHHLSEQQRGLALGKSTKLRCLCAADASVGTYVFLYQGFLA
jgi:hypothetical protein